ncbi:hypothetical protein BAQU_1236 [Bifidobacterium aquikefiri]|uniref:Uncharacterized protein n=1 Tax=Bifidobacterium aquikefiri TaxID=1653207 RepID=A0A261G6Y0_9BIFI|nr:hypothetical protein BAQU_1236 [Bifidobacterium aquikefiri]
MVRITIQPQYNALCHNSVTSPTSGTCTALRSDEIRAHCELIKVSKPNIRETSTIFKHFDVCILQGVHNEQKVQPCLFLYRIIRCASRLS